MQGYIQKLLILSPHILHFFFLEKFSLNHLYFLFSELLSKMTAEAKTGPHKEPLPASSTPQIRVT